MGHNFSSKEQLSFNLMVAAIVYSDFGAQENKAIHVQDTNLGTGNLVVNRRNKIRAFMDLKL